MWVLMGFKPVVVSLGGLGIVYSAQREQEKKDNIKITT